MGNHYKNTLIGKIPEDWEVVRLGDVCNQRNEVVQPSGEGKYRFVGLEHIDSGKIRLHMYSLDIGVKSSKFRFYAGDILYGKLRPYLDKAVLVDFDGICSTDLLVLTPKDEKKVLAEFLVYVIHSHNFIQHAISTTSGTNHPRTSWKAISKFMFGLPPLSEQRKIAKILSTVDKAIEKVDEAIAKTERLKRGLMQELLTKGIGHKEFKYSKELGCKIPKEWEVVRLGDIAKEIRYGITASVTSNSGIPVLRVTDINERGYFNPDSILCAKMPPNEVEKYRLKIGDLVIARSGATAGKVAIYEGLPRILCFASYLIKVSLRDFITSKYLFYVLNSEIGKSQLLSGKRGSAQPNINSRSIRAVRVPLPPLEEQRKIAEILSTVDKKLELEKKRKEKLERIKKGLMNDLLTGRRRVKVY